MPRAACFGACCCLLLLVSHAYALPIQYLPEIPGYIPVYIRLGDQPLEEINPALAEAFHESSGIIKNLREARFDDPKTESPKESTEVNDATVAPKQLVVTLPNTTSEPALKTSEPEKETFVMKIPRPVRKMTRQTREKKLNK